MSLSLKVRTRKGPYDKIEYASISFYLLPNLLCSLIKLFLYNSTILVEIPKYLIIYVNKFVRNLKWPIAPVSTGRGI